MDPRNIRKMLRSGALAVSLMSVALGIFGGYTLATVNAATSGEDDDWNSEASHLRLEGTVAIIASGITGSCAFFTACHACHRQPAQDAAHLLEAALAEAPAAGA